MKVVIIFFNLISDRLCWWDIWMWQLISVIIIFTFSKFIKSHSHQHSKAFSSDLIQFG